MYPVYSIDTLKNKSLVELKAIASERGITPEGNKVYKQTWIDAIDKLQNNPIWRNAYVKTKQPPIETTESIVESPESTVEEVAPVAIQELKTCANCPHFKPHNDTTNKGWCCLFDNFARESHIMTQDCVSTMEDAARVDGLSNNDTAPMEQPINLPNVGETYFAGDFVLRCSQVGGEYAATWEVKQDKQVLGDIRMGWDTFWTHAMSLNIFATPQEATIDLYDSLQKYKQEIQKMSYLDQPRTMQEMADFLIEKGLLVKYEKNKISADTWERILYFTNGKSVDFWDKNRKADEAIAYLQGMIRAYEIMSKSTMPSVQATPTSNHIVRRFTKNWLQTQECTIVGCWSETKVDLWEVVDVYAQAKAEGDSTEDALYSSFPDVADDLQVTTTTNSEFSYSQMMRDFEGCPQVISFFKGEVVGDESSSTPADLAY